MLRWPHHFDMKSTLSILALNGRIALPQFLRMTVSHFFETSASGWCIKKKAAMLQVPQRFHNLGPKDPWWHTAEDFNAAGFEGSDGVGATPCVGTGVIFRRECLASIGGQSYWSVTEDFKTSFNLLSQGFSTMYLARNLVYGIAVDDIPGVHKQRIRWATGGLEILLRDSPLLRCGLSPAATMLFFANAWQYVLSVPSMYYLVAPLIYLYVGVSPIYCLMLEVSVFFGGFILVTRSLQWWQVRLVKIISKDLCLWRGSQQVVWLTPIFLEALCSFIWHEFLCAPVRWVFKLSKSHATFAVTDKSAGTAPWRIIFRTSWFVWVFYSTFAMGLIINLVLPLFTDEQYDLNWSLHFGVSIALCGYICCMLFVQLGVLLPYINKEQKGLVSWWLPTQSCNLNQVVIIEADVKQNWLCRINCFGAPSSERPILTPSSSSSSLESGLEQEIQLGMHVRFRLPPYMLQHWKFRVACGLTLLAVLVGLPYLTLVVNHDSRFLTISLF